MLGHVDHGKTSLLDYIRRTNVTAGEAGGITQHIGAYQALHEGRLITFLDTPGHEAFTAMRARGAQATDIAILVIAADDGLMPQTREAIDHARAAGVPIIVALNKIDLATARPDRVKQQLAELGLVPDDWNGDTLTVEVSATQGLGVDDLLEAILLTAEELDPRANPKASPTGTVLEARMVRGLGVVTTLLVQNGTLRVGDTLVIGEFYGRIKSMTDYIGKRISGRPLYARLCFRDQRHAAAPATSLRSSPMRKRRAALSPKSRRKVGLSRRRPGSASMTCSIACRKGTPKPSI